jgi:amidase
MSTAPLPCRTLIEVALMLRAREITSEQLTQAVLDHIAVHEDDLHAFALLTPEAALAEARACDAEIATAGTTKGPMHGVPIALKDLYAVAGIQNAAGSKALLDLVPTEDCTVVARFREAGAVILGKLNTTEGAMGGYNEHLEHNIPRNPWNLKRWAGASSSGSGSATAAGMAYTTLGSDTGGSIRFPAAACGTVGLKPTWGRVSRAGVLDLAQTLDHVGPLCRCVADAAITLQVIAGPDPDDPTSLPGPPPALFTEGPEWSMLLDLPAGRELRIGVDQSYNSEGVDPELSASIAEAIEMLAQTTGATVVPCAMPANLEAYVGQWSTLCFPEAAHAHRAAGTWPDKADEYGTNFRDILKVGDSLTAVEYANARCVSRR